MQNRNITLVLNHRILTQTSQLFNDGSQGAVGNTLQFTGHSIRQRSTAQVPGLDVPLHQRHAGLLLRKEKGGDWFTVRISNHLYRFMPSYPKYVLKCVLHYTVYLLTQHVVACYLDSLWGKWVHWQHYRATLMDNKNESRGKMVLSCESWWKRRCHVRRGAQSLITLLNVNAAGMSQEPNEPERSF